MQPSDSLSKSAASIGCGTGTVYLACMCGTHTASTNFKHLHSSCHTIFIAVRAADLLSAA